MKKRVLFLLIFAFGNASCTAEDVDADSIPAVQDATFGYQGTSPNDIWGPSSGANGLMHWDGTAWVDMLALAQIPQITNFCIADVGKVWVAGRSVLGILDAQGNLTDYSAQVPIGQSEAFRRVFCSDGTVLLAAGGDRISELFLWNGERFDPIELPDGLPSVNSATIFSSDDIFVSALPLRDVEPDFVRDTAGLDFRFDGRKWTRSSANRTSVSISGTSPSFPATDVWLACGREPAHFDGTILGPLPAPMPATGECTFGYVDGRPIILYNVVGSPDETPEAYSCDTAGNCSLLDITGTTDREYRRLEWDGERWTGDEHVVTIKSCTGAGCGYGAGGPGSLVAGVLRDGTLLLSAVADDNVKRLYFVR